MPVQDELEAADRPGRVPYDSEALSRAFYAALTPAGLAGRTRADWDARILRELAELLPPACRILDVGCGYGRIAVPLAQAGHAVTGLDLSPAMVDAARATAAGAGLDVPFVVGSMTELPFADGSFDVVLCLWSAFHELLEAHAQERALGEMWRVLAPGGFALIEGPPYAEATPDEIAEGIRRGDGYRVLWTVIDGVPNPHYLHDEASYAVRSHAAGVTELSVQVRDWGGRPRLVVRMARP